MSKQIALHMRMECLCLFIQLYVSKHNLKFKKYKKKKYSPTECNPQYTAASEKDRFMGSHYISQLFTFSMS